MVCYTVTKVEGDLGAPSTMICRGGKPTSFQFGIRKQEKVSVTALKVSKDSHRIRKPPLPLPQVQYRPPIIIHTYSPKVIHTDPNGFMSLVQKLTGSSDTRLRLKRKPSKKSAKSNGRTDRRSTDLTDMDAKLLGKEGSNGASDAICASPSSSEDSASFLAPDVCGGDILVKQSNSPRGPLSNYEFDNDDILRPFEPVTSPGINIFSHVKAEPSFSFNDNSFNFFSDGLSSQPTTGPAGTSAVTPASGKPPKPPRPSSLPRPPMQSEHGSYHGIDMNSPLPSPGFLSPGLFAGLPELSPGTAAWSQAFLDCLNNSPQLANQPPLQRQRTPSSGYSPSAEGNTVSLENIHSFFLT
ncbi:uncharacterized protein [Physcomitrium patens]|uniref:VQ domain-containing protein n=1 Tax=Physcomitrium patens TaxID=3218 RepID=A9RR54_PHYPA|nr:uncharacterized protein LOC112282197 [Physcomitrium patens]PNR54428.1 hypothetical protein PHYPA_008105 [Physcomitrium patens]|eukprot:XP_024375325.1 uncharacterized protein LOC112282197 [Physcomitrella patens]